MIFIKKLLLVGIVFIVLMLGIMIGIENSTAVSLSLALFSLPAMSLGLLVILAFFLGAILSYAYCYFLFVVMKKK